MLKLKIPMDLLRNVAAAIVAFWGAPASAQIDFTRWHTPAEVDAILAQFEATYPGLARVQTIGSTHEGRPIKALKISDNAATDETGEGDVVFFALHHAREWITTEMALYLAEHLLTNYGSDAALAADMNALEIWIVPVVNPDGYAYTQTPAATCPTCRMWRKNRRNNGDGTFGVDLNRNWGYQWGLASGSSGLTNQDTYRGPAPFSEPETQALRNFIFGLHNPRALLSYHSYTELYLRPWSYTTADPPGEKTVNAIAERAIARMAAVHGHIYAEDISYTSSGETTDFLWGDSRIAGFTPEMRPKTIALGGFDPPTSEILPNNEENLPAALALIHDAARSEVWIRDHAGDTGAEPSAVWTSTGWSQPFWTSPDIWTVPATLDQGATVDLHVRINNASGMAKNNVTVDIYYADPRIALEFPSLSSTLIATQTVNVPPGGKEIVVPWTTPIGANSWGERHWCVGVVLMRDTDMPLTTQAQRTSNIGIRNFTTTTIVAGTMMMLAATNFLDVDAELKFTVDERTLPPGWKATLADYPKREKRARLEPIERKARLLEATGPLLSPGETVYIPLRVTPPEGAPDGAEATVNISGGLRPLVGGDPAIVGNGYTYRVVKQCDC